MIIGHETLNRIGIQPFTPHPLVKSGRWQTIIPRLWPQKKDRPYDKAHLVKVGPTDKILVFESAPRPHSSSDMCFSDEPDRTRQIVLVHGLAGCYQSHYMIRLAREFQDAGFRVFRVNLRGCGPGLQHSESTHNASQSQDIAQVLQLVTRLYPQSPTTCLGFSLGGNIVLKMLGEHSQAELGNLDSFAVVAPAIKLKNATHYMMRPENRFFDQYFVRRLRRDIATFHKKHPHIPVATLPKKLSLYDIDNLVTAPLGGYSSADHYYESASSYNMLQDIQWPGVILAAEDDPVVPTQDLLDLNPKNIEVVVTEHGGHVSFFGNTSDHRWWMDKFLVRWVLDFDPGS